MRLDHEVALQADCWERLQARLDTRPRCFFPACRGSVPNPASSGVTWSFHLALCGQGTHTRETSLFLTPGENPGG